MTRLENKWEQLYGSQYFDEKQLDYSIVEQHKKMLNYLSDIGNTASFIFDLYKQQYIYASQNLNEMLGIDLQILVSDEGMKTIDNLIHPNDNQQFEQMQLDLYSFLFSLPAGLYADHCPDSWIYIHFYFLFQPLIKWITNIFIHFE